MVNILKWARNYFSVYSKYYKHSSKVELLHDEIRKITSESNFFIYRTMKELISLFKSGKYKTEKKGIFIKLKKDIDSHHEDYKEKIKEIMSKLYYLTP